VTLVAALLSSPALVERLPEAEIAASYGEIVGKLVHSVRWLNTFKDSDRQIDHDPEEAERLRRMVLAMVEDVRAVLIKLAYRVQRLRMLSKEVYRVRRNVAKETLDIYAPLANRLGIGQLKWELEDLSFRYLEPLAYRTLAKALEERRQDRERYVNDFVARLREALAAEGVANADVLGRPKHIYSIWRKMQKKKVEFWEVFDVRAVRVLVDTVSECYAVLGAVHGHWHHLPREFDDYIANPKDNGYQSLHTAVVGPQGKAVEVQIRTRAMDDFAELGVAAHWHYKEGGPQDKRLQRTISSLRQLMEINPSSDALLDNFRNELFADRVFVLTPAGQVLDLFQGSTPLDFAYQIHTDVGHRCRGAKANGRIVTLKYELKNGDQVEILTTKEPKPSRDWLNKDLGYLKSGRARAKVRTWFNLKDREQHLEDGRLILERELKRLNASHVNLEKLTRQLRFDKHSELYIAIGKNDVTAAHIASAVQLLERPPEQKLVRPRPRKPDDKGKGEGISVRGVGNLLTQMAKCCKPVPYDPIVGYITRGKGVTVHRKDCENILALDDENQQRLIEVAWGAEQTENYPVNVRVFAYDRQGLLRDISSVAANEEVNIIAVNTKSDKREQTADMSLTMEIVDIAQLTRVMDKIRQLANVLEVGRQA
jgi:GTP pyrophosphokinase